MPLAFSRVFRFPGFTEDGDGKQRATRSETGHAFTRCTNTGQWNAPVPLNSSSIARQQAVLTLMSLAGCSL